MSSGGAAGRDLRSRRRAPDIDSFPRSCPYGRADRRRLSLGDAGTLAGPGGGAQRNTPLARHGAERARIRDSLNAERARLHAFSARCGDLQHALTLA